MSEGIDSLMKSQWQDASETEQDFHATKTRSAGVHQLFKDGNRDQKRMCSQGHGICSTYESYGKRMRFSEDALSISLS